MAIKTYFLVESIATATERNENFRGEAHLRYYGKEQKCLYSDAPDPFSRKNDLIPYFVMKYGYTRECDARRSWIYNHPEIDLPYWNTEVSIKRARVMPSGKVLIV